MDIFDGNKLASEKKQALIKRASVLMEQGLKPKIAAIVYEGDAGSQLYTDIKQRVAGEIGIEYVRHSYALTDGVDPVIKLIDKLNKDKSVTGIIIQKPIRKSWAEANHLEGKAKDIKKVYDLWWRLQTKKILESKDVDGLNPSIIEVIREDKLEKNNRVLPATARAVLEILETVNIDLNDKKIVILGKSDLLGIPLYEYFLSKKITVENMGRNDLSERVLGGQNLLDFDVVISATGVKNLVTAEMVKNGVVVIDVGEPRGDIDFESVKNKATFITPVPGGVGPMTVLCLMENCLDLLG
ncbi:MAG: bifunctional 5,10-methylenetetrahydrofolate dehydrogenase/5,10-methenyltetrahydrofolate cyclohydrolase [Candidatus Pacebacteria bacterium]|nr:bifunctional 5,10-methylenetetrahydrofolate dehydrogenase/5,10-methenyltetrahydrofolate cyclohydrolase [Candidatus Paceibacterota bacterium]